MLYDLIEALFVILLGTMAPTKNQHEINAYTALRPDGFKCADPFVPTSQIVPTQSYIRTGRSQKPNKEEIGNEMEEDLEEEKHHRAARFNCGAVHTEKTHIEFMGLGERWFRRRIEKV